MTKAKKTKASVPSGAERPKKAQVQEKEKKPLFSSITEGLGHFCVDKRLYFLVFFLAAGILYGSYAFFKIYPIGDGSTLVLDLNGQYVYYYERFRDAFWGDGSLIYSWSRNLSGEMFGIFAYYLASPYMLILLILPRSIMPTSILILQLCKVGSAAVTFQFFLKKISKNPPRTVSLVVFPLLYSLMSYMVVQLMDPMWLDGLIYLPLICWGVHRLVEEGKLGPYIIPLALMFIAHFYIGYMVGIFTFFYFCYVCLSGEGRVLPKHFFKRCLQFGFGTLVALLCAAWVLIPVYNSLKLGKFEFTDPDFSLATQFDFLTFITKLFPMTYDTVYPEGMPMVYCGAICLLLTPLFFMNDRISMKEKTSKGILTVILVILMYIKPVDMAMHGFQVPNWLPYRYSFIFSFLILLMAFRAFEELEGITPKNIGGVFFGLMVFLFWCERENYGHFQLFVTKNQDNGEYINVIQGIWVSMIALSVYFAMVYLAKKYPRSKAAAICLCIIVSGELFANSIDTMDKIDEDVAYSKYSSYEPYISDLRAAVDVIKDFDTDPFYRMEATFHRTVNDAMGTGYASVSHSSSTMNSPALLMLHRLGYAYGGHYTKYDGATELTDALFDIRYIMDKEGDKSFNDDRIKVPSYYKLTTELTRRSEVRKDGKKELRESTFKFYKNPNALGLAYTAWGDILDVELGDDDPFRNQNDIFSALAGYETPCFVKQEIVDTDTENLASSKLVDGHYKYFPADKSQAECHIDYVVRMDRDSALYMYLPAKYERSCNIWVQDDDEYVEGENAMEYAGQFFVGDNYSILNLGEYLEGQEIRVRITIANNDNEAFWRDELFYAFDRECFEQACEKIKTGSLTLDHFEDTRLSGTVNAAFEGQMLFTTIPYEEGWSIKVNGKSVTPEKSLDSLITIPLEAGENRVELRFFPNYLRIALVLTGAGLVLLVFVLLYEVREGKYLGKVLRKVLPFQVVEDAPAEKTAEQEFPELFARDAR